MRIKRFNEMTTNDKLVSENIDADLLGITTNTGRRTGTRNPNRRTQYFYDYYTGKKISGKSKYELNSLMEFSLFLIEFKRIEQAFSKSQSSLNIFVNF